MTTFVRDSKNLKEKLQEIMPWEVLILNKLYNSSSHVFNSLAHAFQQENVNFVELRYAVTKIFSDLSREIYTSYLKASYISPLMDSLYSISDQINISSVSFLNQNVDTMLSAHLMSNNSSKRSFLTQSLKAEIKQIEASEHLEGKILAEDDFDTLMNICNLLTKPDLHHSSFNFMRILDAIKSSEEAHFLTKDLQYIDILVLSALGHCRSWSRIFKDGIQSQKIIPNLLKWAQYMKKEYKEFLDFQVHHSLLSKRHLRETAKKHIMKGSHPEFIQAVRRRRYDEVISFLQSGVSVESIDPEDKNKPALHIACQNGDIEMVKILEKYACDFEGLDYEQLTPIFYAISSENLELIKYVLSKGVNIEHNDNQNRTPFYWSCCQCSCKIVDFLHKQGCNVNALSRLQRSPLTKAAYLGRAEIVELLLSYKETIVDLPGNKGRTALHNAVWGKAGGREGKRVGATQQEDSPDSALILLKKGANVNLKDADGNTPLAIAAASHADRSLPVLIAFGADSNMPNNMGETPFYQACKWGHLEICKIMMQNYSPDPFVKSDAGLDSFEVSIVNGHYELAVFLLEKLNKKIVDNDEYFDSVIRLTSQHFTSDVKIKFLGELLRARPSPPLQFLHDETLRVLTKLKDEQIVKLMQDYLRLWVAKTGMKGEEKVRVIVEEAIKMHWIACCRILYSEYPEEISSFELELGKFDGLGSLRGEDLFFLIENFNMDIFTPDAKGETLLHSFVGQRSMNALLDLLNLVTDVIKAKRTVSNQYLSKISMEFVKELVKAKNKQGCSALDSALINKFYEIHGVLTKFMGEDLEGSIRLAKYRIEMRPSEEAKEHCMKEVLVEKTRKLKEMSLEFGQKESEKGGDNSSKSPNKKEKKIVYKGDLSLCTYKVQKRELEYLEKALMIEENLKDKLHQKGGDKGSKSVSKKKKKDENDIDSVKEANDVKINNEKAGEHTPSPVEEIVVQREVSFIDDEKELERVCREIEEYSLLGVDSEYYMEDRDKHIGFICLLQLSTVKQDYIIDCIKLHQVIFKHLGNIFKSEQIVKVFHGCESDLKWLKADFDIDVVNLFDTSKALMIINNTDLPYSLTYLSSTYLGFALDKSYQKADWRVRPLPKGMLEYARKDSCVLLYLWYLLDGELKYKGPEKMIKMAKNMAVKCWKTLEKSAKSSIEIISLE